MDAKEAAGRKAAERVRIGMKLGLGTGSTSVHFIRAVGERIQTEGLQVVGVPTSERSRILATEVGIPLAELSELGGLDLAIDGADEVDPAFSLIKGGGGALLREKLVAYAAKEFVVVCDHSKIKAELGEFPLPVAVIPFGAETIRKRLLEFCETVVLRMDNAQPESPYVTDDGLFIYDMHFGSIADPPILEQEIKQLCGVVDVGLFVGLTKTVIVGHPNGTTEILELRK